MFGNLHTLTYKAVLKEPIENVNRSSILIILKAFKVVKILPEQLCVLFKSIEVTAISNRLSR